MTKSALEDADSRRFEPPTAGTSVSFYTDAATIEIHHGMALDLSFTCHRFSENDSYQGASGWHAPSPRAAQAFAATVTTIPVPAQLVHRIFLPDDRSLTFPVPWHFLQLCEEVIGCSCTFSTAKRSSRLDPINHFFSIASAARNFRSKCGPDRKPPEFSTQRSPTRDPHVGHGTAAN